MNRILALLICTAALTACHRTDPQQQAAKDDRAVAMVERAQRKLPPLAPLVPEQVAFSDLKRADVGIPVPRDVVMPAAGAGCHFRTRPGEPVTFVATPGVGLAKFEGRLEIFAADSGGPMLSNGLHRDYTSGAHAVRLAEAADGTGAMLDISDKFDRVVYTAAGKWQCS
jgi:hypothetical protein